MLNYQHRLLNEYVELYHKRKKLAEFIRSSMMKDNPSEGLAYDILVLHTQIAIMDSYLAILKIRINSENLQISLEQYLMESFHEGVSDYDGTRSQSKDN